MKKKRLLFSLFFLAILTLVNSSSLHVFAHHQSAEDDCIEDCTLCSLSLEIQLEQDFLPTDIQNLDVTSYTSVTQKQENYQSLATTKNMCAKLYCRPPPQTL